jgi:hypothetical protein
LHKLRSATVSLDSSVVVDFHLTGNLTLLEGLFGGRMLVSNFVTKELADADIQVHSAEEVVLSADDEWDFFHDLRKRKQALGPGELGAITVAIFRHATLLSNDKQAPIGRRGGGGTGVGGHRRSRMCRGNGKYSADNGRRYSRSDDPRRRLDFGRTAGTIPAKNLA